MVPINEVNQAMILAAGPGTRLRPWTDKVPKVLLPIDGKPLLAHEILWLREHGINQIAINLYHLGDQIKEFLADSSRYDVTVRYSQEKELLGTAGGVKQIADFFRDTFVVVCGDVLADFNLKEMIDFHREKKALATISVLSAANRGEVGIVTMADDGRITGFIEKPPQGDNSDMLSNGGIYVLGKEVLDYIPPDIPADFAFDVFPRLIELNLPVYGYHLKPPDYLIDIGTAPAYHQATDDARAGRINVRSEGPEDVSRAERSAVAMTEHS